MDIIPACRVLMKGEEEEDTGGTFAIEDVEEAC